MWRDKLGGVLLLFFTRPNTDDDLTVNNQKLSSRLEKVLLNVQQQLPVRSDAELRMQRELLDVERKMKNLKNGKFSTYKNNTWLNYATQ